MASISLEKKKYRGRGIGVSRWHKEDKGLMTRKTGKASLIFATEKQGESIPKKSATVLL